MKLRNATVVLTLLYPLSPWVGAAPELEHTLVTGVYTPSLQSDLTGTVNVLDVERIAALNKRTVADILKTVPGLLVEELGGPGGLTAVSIRGGEANFTLVLLDGVAVNDPTNTRGGGFDFSRLDPASVERIEVVRGPQSAVYGSDALAGVINIISRRGRPGHKQQLSAVWGEDDFIHYHVAASGVAGEVAYSLDLATRDSGEPVPGSSRDNDEASARIEWRPAQNQFLAIGYRALAGDSTSYPEQSGGPEFAAIDGLDVADYRDQILFADWRVDVSPRWTSTITASRFEHDEDSMSPGVSPFTAVPPNGAKTEFESRRVQWVNTLRVDDAYKLNLGVDYRAEEADSRGYLAFGGFSLPTDFELDRNTVGVFAQLNVQVGPKLQVSGSLRHDAPEDFSDETTANVGLRYALGGQVSINANWGQGFKLPSFFALGHGLVGNPELEPETAQSADVGLAWTLERGVALRGTAFYNDYRELVDFDAERFINVNRKRVKTRGVELEFQWLPVADLDLQAHLTYTDIDLKDSSAQLLGRPEWRAGGNAMWQFADQWDLALDYQWVGEQYASSLHTGDTVVESLDDYQRVDLSLRWRLGEHLSVALAADNLLDEDYHTAVGFAAPGRALRLGFTLASGR